MLQCHNEGKNLHRVLSVLSGHVGKVRRCLRVYSSAPYLLQVGQVPEGLLLCRYSLFSQERGASFADFAFL